MLTKVSESIDRVVKPTESGVYITESNLRVRLHRESPFINRGSYKKPFSIRLGPKVKELELIINFKLPNDDSGPQIMIYQVGNTKKAAVHLNMNGEMCYVTSVQAIGLDEIKMDGISASRLVGVEDCNKAYFGPSTSGSVHVHGSSSRKIGRASSRERV